MNAKSIALAALLATLSIGAHATEASEGPEGVSLKSREEVRSEVQASMKDGSFVQTNEGVSLSAQPLDSTMDRASIRKEAADWLRQHPKAVDDLYTGG
jgi:hypothetical protein